MSIFKAILLGPSIFLNTMRMKIGTSNMSDEEFLNIAIEDGYESTQNLNIGTPMFREWRALVIEASIAASIKQPVPFFSARVAANFLAETGTVPTKEIRDEISQQVIQKMKEIANN